MIAVLLAHQGGWDEMLFVAVPIAIFAWLLRMANKRAARLEHPSPPDDDPSGEADRPPGGPPPR